MQDVVCGISARSVEIRLCKAFGLILSTHGIYTRRALAAALQQSDAHQVEMRPRYLTFRQDVPGGYLVVWRDRHLLNMHVWAHLAGTDLLLASLSWANGRLDIRWCNRDQTQYPETLEEACDWLLKLYQELPQLACLQEKAESRGVESFYEMLHSRKLLSTTPTP